MTENEAIEVLSDFNKQASAKADGAYQSTIGEMACKVAIKALQEIQQYREIGTVNEFKNWKEDWLNKFESLIEYRKIGTVEECREAREKQKAKKPITYKGTNRADCPVCGATVRGINKPFGNWCAGCGTKIDWSEEK